MSEATVEVVLQGGPSHIPAEQRVSKDAAAYGKVKIPSGAGYEHFERVAADSLVFRWTGRTKIAE
ncbi:hypothetical protein HII36_37985 [Nonomuraea sp. NN258]|uniref:DUF5988 family protein n=1 Tax=Nonomuraea antri TaxID=2730852 RepID=UPI0015680D5D|nr:DUF5988 family protein [Nonomuraea antri]NRQ37581.1 hypothetical protein [Nonomuraea antri]